YRRRRVAAQSIWADRTFSGQSAGCGVDRSGPAPFPRARGRGSFEEQQDDASSPNCFRRRIGGKGSAYPPGVTGCVLRRLEERTSLAEEGAEERARRAGSTPLPYGAICGIEPRTEVGIQAADESRSARASSGLRREAGGTA